MLVGIISDTHGRMSDAAYAEMAECDFIVHAGDIGDPSILDELRNLAPVCAVLGNNDFDEYGHDVRWYANELIGGVRFLVMHTPADLKCALVGRSDVIKPGEPMPEVAVHGHTHVPEIVTGSEARGAGVIICPGSPTRPRNGSKPSVAKVLIEDEHVKKAWIVELPRW